MKVVLLVTRQSPLRGMVRAEMHDEDILVTEAAVADAAERLLAIRADVVVVDEIAVAGKGGLEGVAALTRKAPVIALVRTPSTERHTLERAGCAAVLGMPLVPGALEQTVEALLLAGEEHDIDGQALGKGPEETVSAPGPTRDITGERTAVLESVSNARSPETAARAAAEAVLALFDASHCAVLCEGEKGLNTLASAGWSGRAPTVPRTLPALTRLAGDEPGALHFDKCQDADAVAEFGLVDADTAVPIMYRGEVLGWLLAGGLPDLPGTGASLAGFANVLALHLAASRATAAMTKLEAESHRLREEKVRIQLDHVELRRENDRLRQGEAEHESARRALEDQRAGFEETCHGLRSELAQAREQVATAASRNNQLHRDADELMQRVARLEEQLAESRGNAEKAQAAQAALTAERDELAGQTRIATGTIQAMRRESAALEERLDAVQAELERWAAESAASAQRFERLLDALPAGLLLISADRELVSANQAAARLLGVETRNHIKGNLSALGSDVAGIVLTVLNDQEPRAGRGIRTAAGKDPFDMRVNPVPGGGCVVLMTPSSGTSHDEAAPGESAVWRYLASRIAEEVRNPLSTIVALTQVLPDQFVSRAFRERFLEAVPREVHRIERALAGLAAFAETPHMVLHRDGLNQAVARVVSDMESQLAKSAVKVELDMDPGNPEAVLDPFMFGEAMRRIIQNAAEAMTAGGALRLRTRRLNGHCEVYVEDTGPGVPEQDQSAVFLPFFTTKEQHLGLGLTVARHIVELHEGALRLARSGDNGCAFALELPTAETSNGNHTRD